MAKLPRTPLDNILGFHALHPRQQRVYVEGEDDEVVVENWLGWTGHRQATVMHVGRIELGCGLLDRNGLTRGQRQRVAFLARELGNLDSNVGAACIVDRDFAPVIPGDLPAPLFVTDGYCLNSACFHPDAVRKVLKFYTRGNLDPDQVLTGIRDAANQCRAVRAALHPHGIRYGDPDPSRFCELVSGQLKLDVPRFVKHLLGIARAMEHATKVIDQVHGMPASQSPHWDAHDGDSNFLLHGYLKLERQNPTVSKEGLLTSLQVATDPRLMASLPMFQSLATRLGIRIPPPP